MDKEIKSSLRRYSKAMLKMPRKKKKKLLKHVKILIITLRKDSSWDMIDYLAIPNHERNVTIKG